MTLMPKLTDNALLSVLVVDDEPAVTRQLVDGLTLYGFRVTGTDSATEALERLAADADIAVVVTDIRMPGLDGLSLAQRIMRERSDEQAVEVVVITGHATLEDAAAAVRTRVSDFLRKPFRLTEAAKALSTALERARTRRQDASARHLQSDRLQVLERERSALITDMADASRRLANVSGVPKQASKLERDMHAISHALRTPLIAISGGADLLGAPSFTDSAAEYLSMLREGVRQAREAVELVEELHQVERPGPESPLGATPLHDVLIGMVERMQPEAAARKITLEAGSVSSIFPVTDRVRLRRTVELCIAAALEWAQLGSWARASLESIQSQQRDWAVVTVWVVPGSGAPEPSLPNNIAFKEISSLWSRTQEGLRFAIARRLAEQHGGSLTSWNGGAGVMALRLALPL